MTVNKRLKEFLFKQNFKQTDLAERLLVTKQTVNKWVTGAKEISPKQQIELLKIFPDINARWFLFGEGEMFEKEGSVVNEPPAEYANYKDKYIEALEKLTNCTCGAALSKQTG